QGLLVVVAQGRQVGDPARGRAEPDPGARLGAVAVHGHAQGEAARGLDHLAIRGRGELADLDAALAPLGAQVSSEAVPIKLSHAFLRHPNLLEENTPSNNVSISTTMRRLVSLSMADRAVRISERFLSCEKSWMSDSSCPDRSRSRIIFSSPSSAS